MVDCCVQGVSKKPWRAILLYCSMKLQLNDSRVAIQERHLRALQG
jgi:hypothetical protein